MDKYTPPFPRNFDEKDSSFNIFHNIEKLISTKINILHLKNIRISTNSVVFKYFKVFKESCVGEENFLKYNKGFRFFLKFIFPKINFSKKRFLLITDEWTSNYYHWHIFALGRLTVLQEKNLIRDSLLFLPKKYQQYKFVLSSLEKFGINKKQIVFLPKNQILKLVSCFYQMAIFLITR